MSNDRSLKSINVGVWILVAVFVIIPLAVCCGIPLLCTGGPMFLGMFGDFGR